MNRNEFRRQMGLLTAALWAMFFLLTVVAPAIIWAWNRWWMP